MSHQLPPAPIAPKRPHTHEEHGNKRIDNWHWLRNREDPAVKAHLESENAYTDAAMEPLANLKDEIYDEIVARIQETDLSVPVRKGDWLYYGRTVEGQQYPIHCRKPFPDGAEVVLYDENIEAGDNEFFDMGTFDVSPKADLLAYSTDTAGNETFQLRFRDLNTGSDLADEVSDTSYGGAWSKDGSVYFYTREDETKRPFQIWRHRLGSNSSSDVLVYEEDDERFFVGVGNSKTDDFVIIQAGSSLTSEVYFLDANNPDGEFRVVEPRQEGIEYSVSHHRGTNGDRFYVLTNEDAPNFKLMETPVSAPGRKNWTEVIAHDEHVKIDGVDVFSEYLALAQRSNAISQVGIVELSSMKRWVLEQDEEVYTASPGGNAEFETSVIRFGYTSMVTPSSVFEVDLATGKRTLLKQQPVLGDFDPSRYVTKRLWAKAHDGTEIPMSIVSRRDRPSTPGPCLLYGYGSYEMCMDPGFSSVRLSLLDRGFAFVIAHIRGGGEMGRQWYEDGKFLKKKNTFKDFISCAEHLIETGVTTSEQLCIRGGSAGGLLVGAVLNERPDLFGAAVAQVPFVDSLNTMLDPSLPLTIHEYEEWGNPQDPEYYEYMASYAPYENVAARSYPKVLVTAGLNDPRVSYWEPAKWVQKLREHNTSGSTVLLKTEMGAGHMGPSGRYDTWREEAFVYSFIIDTVGAS
jgi:oligopeptidase B